jgi:hypothetical protein
MVEFLIFIIASAGLTHILVDSEIMEPIRVRLELFLPSKIYRVFECHQCTGFWAGILVGILTFWTLWPVELFLCGLMGSYIGLFSSAVIVGLDSIGDDNDSIGDDNE